MRPVIRFKGFSEDWKADRFGGRVLIERGGSPRPIDDFITEASNGLNWVKIGDAPKGGRYITHTAEKIKPEGLNKTREVHPGDLILSNSMSFGRPYIMGIDGCIHDGWLLIRDTAKSFDLEFLCQLLGSDSMLDQYSLLASGSTVNNLNKELVGNTTVHTPTGEEQAVVGRFFRDFDTLIEQNQSEVDRLRNLKKAMLQKMFPQKGSKVPEIRFKGFSGDWETKKLGNMASFSKGAGYSKSDLAESGVPVVLYGRMYTNYRTVITDVDTFAEPKSGAVYSRGGEVVVPASGETAEDISIASVISRPGIILGGDLNVITPSAELDPVFLALAISFGSAHNEMAMRAQGASIFHLHNSDLMTINLMFPEKSEQLMIGQYFQNLDSLIEQRQRNTDRLRHLKQSMLQRMFV